MAAKKKAAEAAEEQAPPATQGGGRNPPAREFRFGHLRASVWENHHATEGVWYSVTFCRSFRDAAGNWKTAHSFGKNDLLALAELARQAYLWIAGVSQLRQPGEEAATEIPI